MPLVDPNIAMSYRGIELPNQLAQYGQVQQIQAAQNQNRLADAQMAEYERGRTQKEGLSNFLTGADLASPTTRQRLLGYGESGRQVYESLLKGEKDAREAQKAEADIAATRMKEARDLLPSVTSPEMYQNWRQYTLKNLPGLANVIPEQYSPATVANLMLEADKALEQNFVSQNLGTSTRVVAMNKYGPGVARVVQGTEASIGMAPGEAERLRNEGLRIGLEGRRIAVDEEKQRRDADPEFQQRMANAKALGEAVAKGDVAAQQALPKIINRAEEGLRLIDELVGKPEVRDKSGKVIQPATQPLPGFETAVGFTWLPGARFVPGTNAANFMARYEQLKGASFLEAFESLKGGGAITETEGTKATSAINRMSLAQDEKEFMAAARDLQSVIRTGVKIARSRAAKTGAPAALDADPLGLR
jgi:hypothetical protein